MPRPATGRQAQCVVLAWAGAAGAEQTVIVADGKHSRRMLIAAGIRLADLPISIMVCGIWAGTLPLGILAKRYGKPHSLCERAAAGNGRGAAG